MAIRKAIADAFLKGLRLVTLPLLTLVLLGARPLDRGTEVTVFGGGGVYEESYSSCGTTYSYQRQRQVGGVSVRHRFEEDLTISGYLAGFESRDLQGRAVDEESGQISDPSLSKSFSGIGAVRIGTEKEGIGADIGAGLGYFDETTLLPFPTASVRLKPTPEFYLQFSALDAEDWLRRIPVSIGLGYRGRHLHTAYTLPVEHGEFGGIEVDLRTDLGLALGGTLRLAESGEFGPRNAGLFRIAYFLHPAGVQKPHPPAIRLPDLDSSDREELW